MIVGIKHHYPMANRMLPRFSVQGVHHKQPEPSHKTTNWLLFIMVHNAVNLVENMVIPMTYLCHETLLSFEKE